MRRETVRRRISSATAARRVRARLVSRLWRSHRRAGLLAALVLLFLAVTGLLLNHADTLGLEHRAVRWDWIYGLYGERAAGDWLAYRAGERWVLQGSEAALFLDSQSIGPCAGRLAGAIAMSTMLVVACEHQLLLLGADGTRIDSLDSATGLEAPIEAVAASQEAAFVLMAGRWRSLDLDAMSFGDEPDTAPQSATPDQPPAELRAALGPATAWLNWERLLLDLHSGRLFGRIGTLVVDLAGLLSIALALSGVMIWGLRRRHRRP